MKSTVVDESLSSFKPMYCSREYQTSTRLNQQYEKSTLNYVLYTQIGKLARLLPSDIPPYICVHSVNSKISEKQFYISSFTQVKEEFHIKT